jgi:hypothetical protein
MIVVRWHSEDRSVAENQDMKARIFLHIGHPKTGSSAFQTCLARSHHALADDGILYPYHRSFAVASRNHISSGNLSIGTENENWMTNGVLPIIQANPGYHTFIFSNENLIHRLADFTCSLETLSDNLEFHILLVVRDPIEQLGSVYQQLVKRHGYAKGYEDFLSEHGYRCNATNKAAAALDILEENRISYSLFNYSVLQSTVIDALARAIGIRDGLVDCSLTTPVNRSMSAAELQLLLFVNAMYGGAVGRKLADSLVNQLPNVTAVSLAMRQESWREVVRVNQDSVESINRRLSSDNQLSFNAKPGFSGELHSDLSGDQLQLCRQILAAAVQEDLLPCASQTAATAMHGQTKEWAYQTNRLMDLTSRLLQNASHTRETARNPKKKRDLN